MKIKFIIFGLLMMSIFACNNSYENAKIESYEDTLSYSIGKDIGKNFERNHLDTIVNVDLLAKGLFDYFNNDSTLMNDMEVKKFLTDFRM